MLVSFKVYADDMETAINTAVAYAEANGYNGLLLDVGEMNEKAREDLAYEKALETLSDEDKAKMSYDDIVNIGKPIVDKMEDETPDEYYDAIDEELSDLIYIDATMEGAKQCYYIFSEVQAEEFDDNKVEESVKSNYARGKDYLENIAKSNNEKYYEIVEDTYEYPNGLMLITYNDEKHEDEKEHICIDLDNLQNLDERFLGPSDETIADSKAKGLYSESAELSYGDLEDLAKDIFDWYDADMGTHFDDVKGNEEIVYGDIMTILETKDQEQIQHFIDDITEADIDDDTAKKIKIATTSSLVERLKALLK